MNGYQRIQRETIMNRCQKIQLDRIRLGSFNNFDGELVADSLAENESLWIAFMFGRFKYAELIELRDLKDDCINADTIMLLCKHSDIPAIQKLAKAWDCNEFGYSAMKDDKFIAVGTAPFRDKNELWQSFGSSLSEGECICRIWWD